MNYSDVNNFSNADWLVSFCDGDFLRNREDAKDAKEDRRGKYELFGLS